MSRSTAACSTSMDRQAGTGRRGRPRPNHGSKLRVLLPRLCPSTSGAGYAPGRMFLQPRHRFVVDRGKRGVYDPVGIAVSVNNATRNRRACRWTHTSRTCGVAGISCPSRGPIPTLSRTTAPKASPASGSLDPGARAKSWSRRVAAPDGTAPPSPPTCPVHPRRKAPSDQGSRLAAIDRNTRPADPARPL